MTLAPLQILATALVWVLTYIPLILLSTVAVPVLMWLGWEGYTGPFGNRRYGVYGNKVYPCKSFFQSWWFLVVRNPISNFGKVTMSVASTATWPWHYDFPMLVIGRLSLWLKAGWKPVADPVQNPERTFVFRPHFEVEPK